MNNDNITIIYTTFLKMKKSNYRTQLGENEMHLQCVKKRNEFKMEIYTKLIYPCTLF